MGAQETIGQGFIFAQESKKQVLGLDVRRPELAGFVACEKDDAPGFLRIAFKHNAFPLTFPDREKLLPARPAEPDPDPADLILYSIAIMQSKGLKTQVLKRFRKP